MIVPILVLYATTLTRPLAVAEFRSAAKLIYRDTGIQFKPKFIPARLGKLDNFGTEQVLDHYKLYFQNEHQYFLLLVKQGLNGNSGMAQVCGYDAIAGIKVPAKIAQDLYHWKRDCFLNSRAAIAHELGHVLGAHHDDTLTVMNPWLGASLVHDLQFSDKSKNEIALCMGNRT